MLISYAWLTELLGVDPGLDRVTERLTLGGLEVEHIEPVGAHLRGVVIAKVVSTRPHPKSRNPLTLVTVFDGENTLEVVCGASNVPPPGGLVCLARVGTTVFDHDAKPFTLQARPVAGIDSHGMLCAEDELSLGNSHGGIIVLDPETPHPPGTPLSDLDGLVDTILTLNVTPNRGDALSHRGVARDVSALLGLGEPHRASPVISSLFDQKSPSPITVTITDPKDCSRYTAALVRNVSVRPSPLSLRVRLHRLGVRSINNLVDVTNLVMLETGQPLHAFDLSRLATGSITVRRAHHGEVLRTLDAVDRELVGTDIVIADSDGPVALAGVMGGERSAITEHTRDIVIECAAFDPRAVRRTARRLSLHSESSHRFERGVDLEALPSVSRRAVSLVTELAHATHDNNFVDVYPSPYVRRRVTLRLARAEALLGCSVSAPEAARSLTALGFDLAHPNTSADVRVLDVGVPAHRNDVSREVDLVEEIARIHGLEKISPTLPRSHGARAGVTRDFSLRRRLRVTLAALGLDEAVFTVFTAPAELTALGFDPTHSIALANPLSAERNLLRPSLLPRLVASVGRARRRGEPRVRLFEVASVFLPKHTPGEALPDELTRVSVVLAGPRDAWLTRPDEMDFYDLKGVVTELCERLTGASPTLHTDGDLPPWAHPRAFARLTLGGRDLGAMGALHPDVVERADLGRTAWVAELDAAALGVMLKKPLAKAPPKYPSVRRDVSLRVAKSIPAGALIEALQSTVGELCEDVVIFDRYAGPELLPTEHALAFALTFRAADRSLSDTEVDRCFEAAVHAVQTRYGAERR